MGGNFNAWVESEQIAGVAITTRAVHHAGRGGPPGGCWAVDGAEREGAEVMGPGEEPEAKQGMDGEGRRKTVVA